MTKSSASRWMAKTKLNDELTDDEDVTTKHNTASHSIKTRKIQAKRGQSAQPGPRKVTALEKKMMEQL